MSIDTEQTRERVSNRRRRILDCRFECCLLGHFGVGDLRRSGGDIRLGASDGRLGGCSGGRVQ